jgi:hypothetical protein
MMTERWITDSSGIYPHVGGGGGSGTGGGGGAVYVGPAAMIPDPLVYGLWVVTGDLGPWAGPIAPGVFSLMVSNGTSWFPVSGGGDGGGVAFTEVFATTEPPVSTGGALLWVDTDSAGAAFSRVIRTTSTDPAVLWTDTFNRDDAIGHEAVGNGWTPDPDLLGDLSIINHALWLDPGVSTGYQRFYTYAPPAAPLAGDIGLEVDWPPANIGFGTGMMCRFDEITTRGVRCWLTSEHDVELGDASWYDAGNVALTTVAEFPASWGTADVNTLRLELRGSAASIYANGVLVRTGEISVNVDIAHGAVGFCGEAAGRVIQAIRVYAL